MLRLVSILRVWFACLMLALPVAADEASVLERLDKQLDRMADAEGFSGAVLVARHNKPIFERAVGMACRRYGMANRVDTKFNVGSINKVFTQVAIAQLMQAGRLDVDATIDRYLPDFPAERARKITVRHLLTMRSGLTHYWTPEYDRTWPEIRTVGDLMKIVREQPLAFEPGTDQAYSNSGYVVLGAIIEAITGQDYYDYCREHIFAPAGMTDTDSYAIDQVVPNLAIGYTANRVPEDPHAQPLQNNLLLHGVRGSPAGGGFSTLADLLRFTIALRENRLVDERHTNLVLGLFENLDDPSRRPPGLGIAGGAPIGVCAILESNFENGYTVVVLSNVDPPTGEELGIRVMRALRALEDA